MMVGATAARDGRQRARLEAALAGLGTGWLILADLRIEAASECIAADYLLLHADHGIALVNAGPRRLPETVDAFAIEGFRRFLQGRGFDAFFPGYLPIVRLTIGSQDAAPAPRLIAESFACVPRLTIADPAWAEAVGTVLTATGSDELVPETAPETAPESAPEIPAEVTPKIAPKPAPEIAAAARPDEPPPRVSPAAPRVAGAGKPADHRAGPSRTPVSVRPESSLQVDRESRLDRLSLPSRQNRLHGGRWLARIVLSIGLASLWLTPTDRPIATAMAPPISSPPAAGPMVRPVGGGSTELAPQRPSATNSRSDRRPISSRRDQSG
jgi:hypothetical protein